MGRHLRLERAVEIGRTSMKKLLTLLALLVLPTLCFAQAQQFSVNIAGAPAAVVVGNSFSTTTATGALVSTTGGSIAAGTYRIGVTCFSSSNTETPLSTDTATTAVATTTGSTSTLTILPPICTGTGNEVGWRMYVGASAGASGAETLQTINATICTLSASTTASCALTSPAVFTSSSGFTSGSGGPASPGTLIYPPTSNAASQSLFENSVPLSHIISWTVSGTAPTACTFQLQTGSAPSSLANVGQAITCTASGTYAVPYVTANAYSSINLSSYTAGGTNTVVTFYMTTLPYILPFYWGNAAPTSACTIGMGMFMNTSTTTTAWYSCAAGTWTAVTLP